MSVKKNKALGELDATGADVLFQVVEDEIPAKPEVKKSRGKTKKGSGGDEKLLKTTIYISEQSQDLIHALKRKYRRDRGKVIPQSPIIADALLELAKKLGIKP